MDRAVHAPERHPSADAKVGPHYDAAGDDGPIGAGEIVAPAPAVWSTRRGARV